MNPHVLIIFIVFLLLYGIFYATRPRIRSASLTFVVGDIMTNDFTASFDKPLILTLASLQADGTPATGATLTGLSVSVSDFTFADVAVDQTTGKVTFTLHKVGSVTVDATATATDPDGTVTTIKGTGTLTVVAGAGDIRSASLQFNWATT